MRILILTHEFPPFRGGIAAVAHGLAIGATAMGHEPVVLAPDYHRQPADLEQPGYSVLRFPGTTCPIVSFRRLTRFTRLCQRVIRDVHPDLVHAADPPAQMALTALSRLGAVRRYFFTVHGTEALRYRDEAFPRAWMWGAFKRVTRVAAVSDAVLQLAVDDLGLPPERGFVAHPAIAPIWHELPAGDRESLRSGWGANPEDIVLLTIARVVPEKGHADVIEALTTLPEATRARVVFAVVGSGPADYARTLSAAAAGAGVRLFLLGELADRETVHVADAADVFVMPSRQTRKRLEGFGIAYIEAAARGLPSLARATGGASEAVRTGETGVVLAQKAGPLEMAIELAQLIDDAALRKRLGLAARRAARAFTWERHAQLVYSSFG